ncbi:MAG: hypothetical protein PHR86_06295 [Desulfobacterales bacterium]|nr:hypothetical protein [Desulfobacterales bacterium]
MKRIPILLILILVLMHSAGQAAGNSEFPKLIDELHSMAAKTFRTEAGASAVKLPDRMEAGRSFTFCLKGQGSLEDVPDPFATMESMFYMNTGDTFQRIRPTVTAAHPLLAKKGITCAIFM